jgi:chitinase
MNSSARFHFLRFFAWLSAVAIVALLVGSLPALAQRRDGDAPKRLLGYYPEWSKYNTPAYSAAQIPYDKLTHISHAFMLLTAQADGTLSVPAGMIEPALISKAHAAGVKVLVSIGGGDGIQGPLFNQMAGSETTRQAFVHNVHNFLRKHGYDGVDVDWEVPDAVDRQNCTILMEELRDELPSPRWLITMATPSDPRSWGQGFDIPALAPLLDFMNVMTYDFYGSWSSGTGHVSPLLLNPADPQQAGSVKTSMDLYGNQYGVPLAKLNIGTPFYGYEFDGVDTLWAECTTCVNSSQNYAPYIKSRINQQGWNTNFDRTAQALYLTNSTIPGFLTFDDPATTAHKTRYVLKKRGFGGVFMWELSADYDGHEQDLLEAMYAVWKSAE